VDTGSSFVLLPARRYVEIMRSIISSRPDCSLGPAPGFRATCSIRESYLLPHVSFVFAGRSFLLAPDEYLLDGADDAGNSVYLLGFSPRASSRADVDEIILGDTFLKKSVPPARAAAAAGEERHRDSSLTSSVLPVLCACAGVRPASLLLRSYYTVFGQC
jgi:hypothetical protein